MDTDPEIDTLALRSHIALLERRLEGQAAELLQARIEHRQLEQELYDAQVALATKEAATGTKTSKGAGPSEGTKAGPSEGTRAGPGTGYGRIARAIAGRRRR